MQLHWLYHNEETDGTAEEIRHVSFIHESGIHESVHEE
jgi:hypothetical protein